MTLRKAYLIVFIIILVDQISKLYIKTNFILGEEVIDCLNADKKIKLLSGGEKARVALAKVIVSKSNFMMLLFYKCYI